DETAVAAALRETYEEIGGNPLRMWSLPYVTQFFSPADNTIHSSPVFGMLIDSNIPIKLSKEHEKYEWLHLELALAKLPLPSHREAAGIFYEYILSADNTHLFELNLNDYLN
ncbi:MAG: NUDIX domain-containing protein, partial [Candidatus Kapaibacterium sp.]